VLQSKNPEAERDVKKLPLKLQSKIAIMMGNKSCCMLCPAKANVFLEWDVFGCCWTPSEPRKCSQEAMDFYGIEVSKSLRTSRHLCDRCNANFGCACMECRSSDHVEKGKFAVMVAHRGCIQYFGVKSEK